MPPSVVQEFCKVAEMSLDGESLAQLPRHQRLPVAYADDLTSHDPLNLGSVIIRVFAASDNCDLKHSRSLFGKLESADGVPLPRGLGATSSALP